jgi:glycosidase
VSVRLAVGGHAVELAVTLVSGGHEVLGPTGGLTYPGAERTSWDAEGGDGWTLALEQRVRPEAPRIEVGFTVGRAPGGPPVLLRDVELELSLALGDGEWALNAPGNHLRADLDPRALRAPVPIRTAGDTLGSPGIVALTRGAAETVVAWPLCDTELGAIDLAADAGAARLTIRTGLAGRLDPGGPGLTWGTLRLDALAADWPGVRAQLGGWWERLGVRAPADAPAWLGRAHIYEAHVGFSVFAGGERYERYPTVAALEADLPRIRALGFDAIQLMPRHPYPSYNVHDYADVTTTYGDEAAVRSLVGACHALGMRILLDVIMHGVVDREVVGETVAAVRAGPHADRLGDGTLDVFSRAAEDVAWSRHIVEYGPYWHAGSPARHPLPDAHPEWFMRDSAGRITRRYTKAFDIAHPGWQRYFLDACADLVARLDVDGFRVDAPTYNDFASWAHGRAGRASDGAMASLGLLRELRTRLRAIRADLAVHTEPTGGLFRAAADATYNYDEHWLVETLLGGPHPERDRRGVRDARELARWLQDRDAALPPGSAIVHHIDSHDSIWWRLPGAQWRRERFGRDAAVALLAVFAFGGGGFMTFMGGEDGLGDALERAHALRRDVPELAAGTTSYAAAADMVLCVRRTLAERTALVAVNLGADPVACALGAGNAGDLWSGVELAGDPVAFAPYQVRVLALRS